MIFGSVGLEHRVKIWPSQPVIDWLPQAFCTGCTVATKTPHIGVLSGTLDTIVLVCRARHAIVQAKLQYLVG